MNKGLLFYMENFPIKITRRLNQKLAQKRKHNDQHLAEKEVKKARKADVVQTTSCLVVEQLVGGPSLALPALVSLARCGEEDPPDQMDEIYAGEVLK